MNYKTIYENLIQSRSNQPLLKDEYYESHHIIPRCMGGTDDPQNLIKLTAREHFLAHHLLTKIYPAEHKLFYALFCMIRDPHSKRKYTSRVYEIAKKEYIKMQRVRQTENNMMWTDEAKKKISESMKGDNNPMRKYPEKNPGWGKSFVRGKKWYNNGSQNLYLSPDEPIPEGYVVGMKYSPKKRK
jgi:hypothetical protein